MYKEIRELFIILLGLMGLCPVVWYIWLAVGTDEGRKMLGVCIGLAFFHFMLSLVFFCYIPVNRWIRKTNKMRNVDVEAGMDEDLVDDLDGETVAVVQDVEMGQVDTLMDVKVEEEDQEAQDAI